MIIKFNDVLRAWKNRLTSYILNIYDVDGLPHTISPMYFKKVALDNAAIFANGGSLYALPYTIRNVPNYDYTPKDILCTNPYMSNGKQTYNLTVGENAELIYYYPTDIYLYDDKSMSTTLKQYVNDTAAQLAVIDVSIAVCAENLRYNVAIVAGDDNDKASLETALTKLKIGEIPVLTSIELLSSGVHSVDLTGKRNITLSDLTELKQNVLSSFLQSLGYSVQNNFKREYVQGGELERNDILADISETIIFDTLNSCITKINNMFKLNIQIKRKGGKRIDTE